jgi:hypothetical protein
MTDNFYIYEHWRTDTNCCFYVGKGNGDRAYRFLRRSKKHKSICEKVKASGHRVEVRIVMCCLSETEALLQERNRIAYWRSQGGASANLTDGGEGTSGYKHSSASRIKMSLSKKGRPGMKTMLGKKQSESAKQKISAANKGRVKSDETRERLSFSKKGKPSPLKGKSRDKDIVAKISLALRGRPLSAAHREKLRHAWQRRKQNSVTGVIA